MRFGFVMKTHAQHLAMVLNVLQDKQLFANEKKCVFAQSRINHLGHWVSKHGVEADGDKIKATVNWPISNNVTKLRGFLGLTGYYHRFVKDYGTLAGPLTQLLHKDSFRWTAAVVEAFKVLKQAIVTLPVLALPNFN